MDEPTELFENLTIDGDLPLNMDTMRLIPCPYTDIITEFADVEIFLISVDSLILELCAHQYHNWRLGGQTIILCEQIKQFLGALEDLNAKFKLVVFSGLAPLFASDAYLAFLHPLVLAFLGKSKWADDVMVFASPLDPLWDQYLHQLTPSFMLLSLENAPAELVRESIDFIGPFITIAIHLINEAIPVVLFNGFTINYTSVMAFRFTTVSINIDRFIEKIANLWPENYKLPERVRNDELFKCQNAPDFWALIIGMEMEDKNEDSGEEFQQFCNAALLSSLVCVRLRHQRRYLENEADINKGPSIAQNKYRRRLLNKAQHLLSHSDFQSIKMPLNELEDIWDGRMVLSVHKKIMAKDQILPLRLQDDFSKLHKTANLSLPLATDLTDKLLDPLSPSEERPKEQRINDCHLFAVENELLKQYIPELQELMSTNNCATKFEPDFARIMTANFKWDFKQIGDPIIARQEQQRLQEKRDMDDYKKAKRLTRRRHALSTWYQLFSDSLEGQGGQMLVDFSRVVKMPTIAEDGPLNGKEDMAKKGAGKKDAGKGGGKKGGKPGAGGGISKKEQILQANRGAKNKEQVQSDRIKIDFATRMRTNTISALDNLMRQLELDESKAECMFQKVLCYADVFAEQLASFDNLDQKREGALGLVESIKAIFIRYYKYLDDQQKEKILFLWVSLGFGNPDLIKRRPETQHSLDMDLIYYQLRYGGRMVDVLSDPKKDDRVTGFWPDAWQRRMLDAVDQDKSALIVAPTSAGKTFVSYYCIEKVLRKSDEDVVVYISPSKALTNQIVGSVYARFRGKNMAGGKVLYGICTNEIVNNPLNCQVLVTIPDCFEQILLSTDQRCQSFVSRIKYVILDEVHCINQKDTQGASLGHIWEHIFLLIRCPFLALSATISNIGTLQDWLQTAEELKPIEGTKPRNVELITYDERWSELELSFQRLRECPKGLQFDNDEEQFLRGSSVASNYREEDETEFAAEEEKKTTAENQDEGEDVDRLSTRSPVPSEMSQQSKALWADILQYFSPFAVYKLEKLRMFGIPSDQRLTARQVLELYQIMSSVDPRVKDEFEPCKFFKQIHPVEVDAAPDASLWLNRVDLRKLEMVLKECFVDWMKTDKAKIDRIFAQLELEVKDEFEKRSKLTNMRSSALFNIIPLIDQLKRKEQIPALCFNDDREICEHLAIRVFNELQKREDAYKISAEFQRKYNFKAEEKAQKLAKRKRDEEEKAAKRKSKRTDEEGNVQRHEKEDESEKGDVDVFAELKMKMRKDLERFKMYGRWSDEDIYNKVVENLSKRLERRSTKLLLRLIQRGIGFHHDGLSNAERSAVEVLFRRGFLGIVFSTSTLALGMNLPCKTVIFGVDTPKLTPLQFRQMSGRAGRRGFDPAGTVIFMSLPTSKVRRLLTASLATLRGNVPFTAAFLLRLFAYISGSSDEKTSDKSAANAKEQQKGKGGKKQITALDTFDVQNAIVRRKAALTLLKVPFVLKTRHEHQKGTSSNLMKYLTFFNVQLLRQLQLLDEKCSLHGLAHLAVHLSQYEPGNLVFIRLLQGSLYSYLRQVKKYDLTHETQRTQAKDDIVCLLAHLFTQKPLPLFTFTDDASADNESLPILPPLDPTIEETIQKFNAEVDQLLLACLQLANRQIENPIFVLSGRTEECLSTCNGRKNFVSVFNSDFHLDESLIPMVRSQSFDHRKRKIMMNSYAYDFWKNPDPELLLTRNKLSVSERWYLINEFNKLLTDIADALKQLASQQDELYKLMVGDEKRRDDEKWKEGIASEYDAKFRTAFKMKIRVQVHEE